MINLWEVPRSKIEFFIDNLYKTERNRGILRDRVLDGMTYDVILEKHFPDSIWWGRRDRNLQIEKIRKMEAKLKKAIQQEATE